MTKFLQVERIVVKNWVAKDRNIPASMDVVVEVETAKAIRVSGHASADAPIACSRCGMALTHPASRVIGVGPVCCKHWGIPYKETLDPEQLAYLQTLVRAIKVESVWIPKSTVKSRGPLFIAEVEVEGVDPEPPTKGGTTPANAPEVLEHPQEVVPIAAAVTAGTPEFAASVMEEGTELVRVHVVDNALTVNWPCLATLLDPMPGMTTTMANFEAAKGLAERVLELVRKNGMDGNEPDGKVRTVVVAKVPAMAGATVSGEDDDEVFEVVMPVSEQTKALQTLVAEKNGNLDRALDWIEKEYGAPWTKLSRGTRDKVLERVAKFAPAKPEAGEQYNAVVGTDGFIRVRCAYSDNAMVKSIGGYTWEKGTQTWRFQASTGVALALTRMFPRKNLAPEVLQIADAVKKASAAKGTDDGRLP